ncbi:hypothetical protein AOQ84DRAFT_143292 [Glonium stellatum]|uniref:Uncharacterized protein n=1 Tax=Glonium stellatum TaxID=574774 RepID=A0A8E2ERN0_9PEZI|nr:hypothetical protein AOQ84DRAFT_143292 [Glonium stellatum]
MVALGILYFLAKEQNSTRNSSTREPGNSKEIVLTLRLLIIGRKRVFWKFVGGEDVDVGSMDWNGYCASVGLTIICLTREGRIVHPKLSVRPADFLSIYGSQQAERLPGHFRTWKLVAKDYSTRQLTNPMDKPSLLLGIVAYFQDAVQDSYLTGLWEKHLLHELP